MPGQGSGTRSKLTLGPRGFCPIAPPAGLLGADNSHSDTLFLQLYFKREAEVYPAGTDNSWYFLSTHYVSGWHGFQLSSH